MNHLALYTLDARTEVNVYYDEAQDYSWCEDKAVLAEVEAGTRFQVVIVVGVVDKSGEMRGTDVLGGVDVDTEAPEAMIDQICEAVEAHGMIEEATADLNAKLARILAVNGGGAK